MTTEELRESLLSAPKNGYNGLTDAQRAEMNDYCKRYAAVMDACKTEREATAWTVEVAEKNGFKALVPGMELKGTVRNVTDFGAFIDIGVHQDGLVHISQITNKFIKHPSEVLKVGQIVTVWVIAVDAAKKRISLTMKEIKSQENK